MDMHRQQVSVRGLELAAHVADKLGRVHALHPDVVNWNHLDRRPIIMRIIYYSIVYHVIFTI